MLELTVSSQFQDCAELTYKNAGTHGAGARKAVKNAWEKVGIKV
jgi:Zn-dependent metalloprotease